MRTASVAETKTRLSSLIANVQAGDDVVITRRGQPFARLVPEPGASGFGWSALRTWVAAAPAEGLTVAQMREQDLL
jgi:prevent-host-death family protein